MALVTTKNMFEKAFKGNYSIGAFNINNMEIIQGVVEACQKHNTAVILQVSKSALKYAHPLYLKKMVEAAPFILTTVLILKHARNVSTTALHQ